MQRNLLTKARDAFCKKLSSSDTTNQSHNKKKTHTAVILKESRCSFLIACWNCGKRLWVMKGSRCHAVGLCSKCIGAFNSGTNTVKRG